MMNDSPWKCDRAAFDVMFSDEAEFTINKTGERGTLKCCAFPNEDTDPFADSDNVSFVMSMSVLVKKSDWHFHADKPSIGDTIRLPNGDKYKVQTISAE